MLGSRSMLAAMASLLTLSSACGGRTEFRFEDPMDAGADVPDDAGPKRITRAEKLDVLLVIDNSETGRSFHTILSSSVGYLLDRLQNPRCVNGLGQIVDEPGSPDAPCAVGERDFAPVDDLHIGVISTSIGGHGADSCSPGGPSFHPHQNDRGQLLTRTNADGVVPSYQNMGFLAWDPHQAKSPPGEQDAGALAAKLREIVDGVGNRGCGFEAQLESFYRFLIDPEPYERIVVEDGSARPMGIDTRVLEQRAAFLRPDSALLIVVLSDEDDCSTREGGQHFYSNQNLAGDGTPFYLPRPRQECAVDPNDPCCASCGQTPPSGCPPDPTCQAGPLSEEDDPINLRCFDQKRRFGIDFLYPTVRYVDALREPTIADRNGNLVPNPLLANGRSPSLVMLAGVVGVPWQDIALAPENLGAGFVPATELAWERVIGSDDAPPTDPLMIASRAPRTGVHPVTQEPLEPPTAPSPEANTINGHEHQISTELQYACIYPLPAAFGCDQSCPCTAGSIHGLDPLCQDPVSGIYGDVQHAGRALPATRLLTVLRDLGPQAIVGSICTGKASLDSDAYGYKPSIAAMMRRLRSSLVE